MSKNPASSVGGRIRIKAVQKGINERQNTSVKHAAEQTQGRCQGNCIQAARRQKGSGLETWNIRGIFCRLTFVVTRDRDR
jgi:hypothetical protein